MYIYLKSLNKILIIFNFKNNFMNNKYVKIGMQAVFIIACGVSSLYLYDYMKTKSFLKKATPAPAPAV